jgi:hypothetical protein
MERGFYFEEWLLQKLQLVKLFVHHIISDHSKNLNQRAHFGGPFILEEQSSLLGIK